MTLSACNDLLDAGSRDFKGDIAGTTEEIALRQEIKKGHGTTSFNGGDFYFIGIDGNLYRTDLIQKRITKLTKTPDEKLERIRAVTDNWIIAGSDTLLMALKKDGSSDKPVMLIENTKTKG